MDVEAPGGDRQDKKGGQGRDRSDSLDASGAVMPGKARDRGLVESPTTRLALKEFYREFRAKEKASGGDPTLARSYAERCLQDELIPEKAHWRIYLELADLAKRENKWAEARAFYRTACQTQPYAPQCWLEWAKMEEERGSMKLSGQVLQTGLRYCEYSEGLLTRAIKHEERRSTTEDSMRNLMSTSERLISHIGDGELVPLALRAHEMAGAVSSADAEGSTVDEDGGLREARVLLARLKHTSIDKVWRTVLEGALLEARTGQIETARKVFKYLMTHVPWYGPIYHEAVRLEEKAEKPLAALRIVERGLQEIPRYGPLWFGLFRVAERLDVDEWLRTIRAHVAGRRSPSDGGGGGRAEDLADPLRDPVVLEPSMQRTRQGIINAMGAISKELIWKVHFEAAQIEERTAAVTCHELMLCRQDRGLQARPWERVSKSRHRIDGLHRARAAYIQSVLACPLNLRWKVWLASARMELSSPTNVKLLEGDGDHVRLAKERSLVIARKLFARAYAEVPEKSKAHVLLECARLEEYASPQDPSVARYILNRACHETRSEWKVFLEAVMLELRACNWKGAAECAVSALEIHSGTGRLWAIVVQLRQRRSAWCESLVQETIGYYQRAGLPPLEVMAPFAVPATATDPPASPPAGVTEAPLADETRAWDSSWAQQATLRLALNEVPKSGEVWCEGARMHLNPLSWVFDLVLAQRYIDFAIQFTPQYGDSFMEHLRLSLLVEHVLPRAERLIQMCGAPQLGAIMQRLHESVHRAQDQPYDKRSAMEEILRVCSDAEALSATCILAPPREIFRALGREGQSRDSLTVADLEQAVFERLELRCTNADPNYGVMWFQCRGRPSDTAAQILRRAQRWMAKEINVLSPLYVQALYRRLMVEKILVKIVELHPHQEHLMRLLRERSWDDLCEAVLRRSAPVDPQSLCLAPRAEDFITGLAGLNRLGTVISTSSDENRRKVLFGSDQIIP